MQQQVEGRQQKAPRLREVAGISAAVSAAVWAVVAATAVGAAADWWSARVVRQYVDGTVTARRVDEADRLNLLVTGLSAVTLLVAAVVFVVWMRRVRENAEFFCDAKHHHARAWTVLGWLVPVMSFWVPWQFLNNVMAASDPRVRARGDWIANARYSVVGVWWALWVLQSVTAAMSGLMLTQANTALRAEVPEKLASVAMWSTLSAVFCCAAAIACLRMVRQINDLQESRPAVPWWG